MNNSIRKTSKQCLSLIQKQIDIIQNAEPYDKANLVSALFLPATTACSRIQDVFEEVSSEDPIQKNVVISHKLRDAVIGCDCNRLDIELLKDALWVALWPGIKPVSVTLNVVEQGKVKCKSLKANGEKSWQETHSLVLNAYKNNSSITFCFAD
jgi:hypothetical protein